jgi:hypothetical protein
VREAVKTTIEREELLKLLRGSIDVLLAGFCDSNNSHFADKLIVMVRKLEGGGDG